MIQRKNLCEHSRRRWIRRRQGFGQFTGAGSGVGKHHVIELQGSSLFVQGVHEVGLGLARPGPGTDPLEAGVVDVDHDDAALLGRLRAELPDQIRAALIDLLQCGRREQGHGRPYHQGNTQGGPSQATLHQWNSPLGHGRDQSVIPDRLPVPTVFSKK